MGTIKVTPVKNNNQQSTAYGKWFMQVAQDNTLNVEDLANHIAKDSGVERTKVAEVTRAIVKQIDELLLNGHAIRIPHLGLLKLGTNSSGTEKVSDFHAGRDIKALRLILVPTREIKEELRNMKYEKTYYENAYAKQQARDAAMAEAEKENEGGA